MASYGDRLTFRYPLVLVGLAAVFVGCEKRPEIAHYQVAKEAVANDQSAADETAGNVEATDRMLAAIVPHDGQAWFFKLSGPEAAVSKVAEAFESFVKTVSFPEKLGGKPDWKLPEGWEQKSGGAALRYATITIPADGKAMELTVSMPLPWKVGGEQELLINVNRWRGQMQLPPVGAKDVSNDTHTLNLADANSDAIVVDLKGRLRAGGMTPPFAGKAAGELPAGHPPVAKSADEKKPAPPPTTTAKSPSSQAPTLAAASQTDLPLTFNVPKGWEPTKPSSAFIMLAFKTEVNSKPIAVTISQAAGSMLANVNRWRDQVGLPPIGDSELASVAHPFKVDGHDAQMVRLFGLEGAEDRKAIVAAVVPQDEGAWFFKMMGPAAAVEHEQSNFEKFLDSVKFRGER